MMTAKSSTPPSASLYPEKPVLETPAAAFDDGAGRASWKAVYTIVERGSRKHWLRIGVAFVNRDGSLNVRLDAVPINGQLHIRTALPRDGRDGNADPLVLEREPRSLWRD